MLLAPYQVRQGLLGGGKLEGGGKTGFLFQVQEQVCEFYTCLLLECAEYRVFAEEPWLGVLVISGLNNVGKNKRIKEDCEKVEYKKPSINC